MAGGVSPFSFLLHFSSMPRPAFNQRTQFEVKKLINEYSLLVAPVIGIECARRMGEV
jgi:hypothetical protein